MHRKIADDIFINSTPSEVFAESFCKSTKIINENRSVKKQNTTMIDEKIGLRWKSPDMRWEIEIVIYSRLNNVSSG